MKTRIATATSTRIVSATPGRSSHAKSDTMRACLAEALARRRGGARRASTCDAATHSARARIDPAIGASLRMR
ncbi:hypothetical protein D3C83_97960 [compost metagenome]